MTLQRTLASIIAIMLVGLSAAAQSRAKKDDPDVKEIRDYRLSMDIVDRYVRAVKSTIADPAAKKCFENNSPGNAPTWMRARRLSTHVPPRSPTSKPPASSRANS